METESEHTLSLLIFKLSNFLLIFSGLYRYKDYISNVPLNRITQDALITHIIIRG